MNNCEKCICHPVIRYVEKTSMMLSDMKMLHEITDWQTGLGLIVYRFSDDSYQSGLKEQHRG